MKKFLFAFLLFVSLLPAFSLPNGFSKIQLGMSVDELKDALKKDHQFGYRGDRDVSLSPQSGQTLIETDATYEPFSFLDRCYFQFNNEKLYIITINLKETKIDHYSILSKLIEKYGNPDEINPNKSTWKDDSVIMSLERPLTLKYVDAKAFNENLDKSNVRETAGEKAREDFLNEL
ncbi:MAG: hypothetical protein SOT81_06680 [Treponema sp.]|nr:hypothetical protein [Treponema sp.]